MAVIAMGYPYATKVVSGSNILPLNNTRLVAGRTYYVKVAFRTRGDGDSTAAKCSSVGFIAYWDSWKQARSYIHNSAQAYAERGAFVSWTYSFTVTSDAQPTDTALYFIINNAWANGYDNQTIDLYYAKYWDSAGNVYNEWGEDCGMLNIRQGGKTYQPVFASSVKYTTPSYCFRRDGKTFYIPLAPEPSTMESNACIVTTGAKKYTVAFNFTSNPRKGVRFNGKTYRIPNKIYVEDIPQYAIPAGSYSPSSFATLIGKYMTYGGYRELASQCTVTVNGQTLTLTPGTRIYYIVASSYFKSAVGVGFGVSSFYENNVSQMHGSSGFTNKKVYVVGNPGDLYYFNLYANYYITVGTGINFK
ncbi:MAG: hypothetical protein HDR56_01535 [Treponema sp.]|nr:hypothetical protein [Treponema sp.]MBD5414361.1 hypothetical protein [Treponema sp.]